MHISHQKHLISNVKAWASAIEHALKGQHEEGDHAHPATAAGRKVTIKQSLDNLQRDLAELEPVLREQNQ